MKTQNSEQLLTYEEVASKMGVSVRSMYRMVDAGEFVKPVRVSSRAVRFPKSEVDAHLANLMAQRG